MTATDTAHVALNRAVWARNNREYGDARAAEAWAADAVTWGVFRVPDTTVHALPDVGGLDVVELGCGTGYFGAWLKRAGARRVVGVDVTPEQLATARRCDAETGLGLRFVLANAEYVPLAGAQFDLAVSEYGASIWCRPELWIAEAARLLRPGGRLVFLRNSTVSMLCQPDTGAITTALQRPWTSLRRLEWADDDPGIEFHPGTGEMHAILTGAGFTVERIIDVMAPPDAVDHPRYDYVSVAWAQRWPAEEIWMARQ